MRKEVIDAEHKFGHYGAAKTTERVSRYNYWPSLSRDCAAAVAACELCQRFKRKPVQEGLLHSVTSSAPNEIVFADFKATPTSRRRKTQVLVYVDAYTRFVHLRAARSTRAKDAIHAISEIFNSAGAPATLVCDEGPAFTSQEFKNFISTFGVKLHVIPPNAHQANGLAEAYAKIVGERIALMCHAMLDKWDCHLHEIQLAINDSFSRAMDNTPFFLQFGYHPRRTPLQQVIPRDSYKAVADHLEQLWTARLLSQNSLQSSQETSARRYNTNRNAGSYKPNQRVWIFYEQRSDPDCPKKYALPWRKGRIIEAVNDVTYLAKTREAGKTIAKKVHINFIKKRA